MIDNIRFNFRFEPDENWLTKVKENLILKDGWYNGKWKTYSGKLFLDKNITKRENKKNKPYLKVEILIFNDTKEAKIIIRNSLRKWFYDPTVNRDFNKTEFNECLNLISKKLFVSPEILLDAKVTKVEYGANLKLSEKFRCFYTCIHSHFDLKKKCIYGDETVEFKGENRSVIFYDKITEEKGNLFKAKFEKQLNNKILLLRYEIKVNKMSGAPEKPFMDSISKIIENWNTIANLWHKELDKITFFDNMNPAIYDYLKDAKIKPITQYLVYLGMEHLGEENWRLILSDRMYSKTRKTAMDSQRKIYNDFKEKLNEENFESIFKSIVKTKAEYLKA